MRKVIGYFTKRHLLINLILLVTLLGGGVVWNGIGKEEMPEFAMDWQRVNLRFPGASAEDVELFVTKPVEENLRQISGLKSVRSTSALGSSSFRIEFDQSVVDDQEIIQQIKDAVEQTRLPDEVEDPIYSRFTSATKAILDIGVFHKAEASLNHHSRAQLQRHALAFETRLVGLPEVSGVTRQGYLQPEIQILLKPAKLAQLEISLNQVRQQILQQNVRQPAGSLKDKAGTAITVVGELDQIGALENLVIQGNLGQPAVTLKQVASVSYGFAESNTVRKAQGHEAIIYNVRKAAGTDILTAQRAVLAFIAEYRDQQAATPLGIVTADDESYDVRNRLGIITANGLLGFALIVVILLIFLDFKSGVWVAMGIPFTLCFTLICAYLLGYTVNNMTLAAVIIVLGIVVDDAIIVAESINRLWRQGMPLSQAVIEGSAGVLQPIVASILTTCAAFIPLYYFTGWFGLLVKYIPLIIFLMLIASLLESLLLLPGHLAAPWPWQRRVGPAKATAGQHWFTPVEDCYSRVMTKVLKWRYAVLLGFVVAGAGGYHLFTTEFKYVMFPRQESKEISVRVQGPDEVSRYEMAELIRPIEEIFLAEQATVVAVLSRIGQNRRGGAVKENRASIRVEILPRSQRQESLDALLARWQAKADQIEGFKQIKFLRSRWGSGSGSPIEIQILENNDELRMQVGRRIVDFLERHPDVENAELDTPLTTPSYRLELQQDELFKRGIRGQDVAQTVRTAIAGRVVLTDIKGDEEIHIRLALEDTEKTDIKQILKLTVANQQGYLVPLGQLVKVDGGRKPANIHREDFKRQAEVLADFKEGSTITPLEVAAQLESELFPGLFQDSPATLLRFKGEIADSRESQTQFRDAIILVVVLIYVLLILLYSSWSLPLVIATVLPFGAMGVVLGFWLHDLSVYGFYAVIGSLGMIGVVVNDAIVMVSRFRQVDLATSTHKLIAELAATRVRPIVVTTLTTTAGLLPTAYGLAGYDASLAEMMLAMGWGLIFATVVTLVFLPCVYVSYLQLQRFFVGQRGAQ